MPRRPACDRCSPRARPVCEKRTVAVDRAAALVRDIEAIPSALEACRTSVVAPGDRRPGRQIRRVVLTGLGSSRFAALVAASAFRAAGLEVIVEPASTDTPDPSDADTLVVAISSSGRTPETVAAAERHRGRAQVVALTHEPESPLARAADATIRLPIAAEASGIATTSYVATVAVLLRLAAALGPRRAGAPDAAVSIGRAALAVRELLAARASWLGETLAALGDAEAVAVLAPAGSIGVAEQAALLFREGPRLGAVAFETAEWLHVGIYTALPGSVAILLAGSPSDAEVVRTVLGRSGRVVAVGAPVPGAAAVVPGSHDVGDPDAHRLAEIVGPALLAAELWRAIPGGPSAGRAGLG